MNKRFFSGMAFASFALCAACLVSSATGRISAVDSLGRTVTLAAPALRIVSLSPAATETLFAIGAGRAVVGDTTYCDYPAEALAVAKVGGFSAKTISVERILALKPELVVTTGKLHSSIEDALAKLGIPCFAYSPSDFSGIASAIESLGILSGAKEKAHAVADGMLAKIETVRLAVAKASSAKTPTVFWEVYEEPLMTAGAESFPHALVELAGGVDIFGDLPGSWPRVSAEEVIRRAPEYIMGADDHGDKLTPAAVSARPGWGTIPAVRNGRILLFPSALVSRAGPRIADGALEIAKALHPEVEF